MASPIGIRYSLTTVMGASLAFRGLPHTSTELICVPSYTLVYNISPTVTFHHLRYTYSSFLAMGGVWLQAIAEA